MDILFLSRATTSVARFANGFQAPGLHRRPKPAHPPPMRGEPYQDRTSQVAVVFLSMRTADDSDGYARAAAAMDALAAAQPGYRGVDSARNPDGFGITVSWWADEASAVAWRRHPVHAAIRDEGRAHWYAGYEVAVATVERSYGWSR